MKTFGAAVIQARRNPEVAGLGTDPFLPGFSFDHLVSSVDAWLELHERLAASAAGSGASLIAMTEDLTHVGLVGTYLDDRDLFRRIAEHQADLVPRRLGALAGRLGVHLVASYFATEGPTIRNFAELFGPDGRSLGRYRKVHLPPYERWMVSPGNDYPVFDTDLGKAGMLICYDQMWPEPFACLALAGAELVLQPSAATIPDYRMLCRTSDHHIFYVSACARGSMIAAPRERILARAGSEDPTVISARLEGSLIGLGSDRYYDALYSGIRAHRSRELVARRPETYGSLSAPEPPVMRDIAPVALADSPGQISEIYRRHREAHLATAAGKPDPFHWEYWRDEEEDRTQEPVGR